jgi:hypothetical protein
VRLTVPETVAPAAGEVMDTVGAVVSPDGVGELFGPLFPLTTPEQPESPIPPRAKVSKRQIIKGKCLLFRLVSVATALDIMLPPESSVPCQLLRQMHIAHCQTSGRYLGM